jgi:hypothetical protein
VSDSGRTEFDGIGNGEIEMGHYTKKRLDEMDDYQSIRDGRLTPEEQSVQDQEVEQELAALKAMQESISKELAAWMANQGIGVVKLTELLRSSTRQTNRIMNAEANVTLATIASLAKLMKKKPKITFE